MRIKEQTGKYRILQIHLDVIICKLVTWACVYCAYVAGHPDFYSRSFRCHVHFPGTFAPWSLPCNVSSSPNWSGSENAKLLRTGCHSSVPSNGHGSLPLGVVSEVSVIAEVMNLLMLFYLFYLMSFIYLFMSVFVSFLSYLFMSFLCMPQYLSMFWISTLLSSYPGKFHIQASLHIACHTQSV